MSGEREVWEWEQIGEPWFEVRVVGTSRRIVLCGERENAVQIVREHNAYQEAVGALEYIIANEVCECWDNESPDCGINLARAALQSIKEQGA